MAWEGIDQFNTEEQTVKLSSPLFCGTGFEEFELETEIVRSYGLSTSAGYNVRFSRSNFNKLLFSVFFSNILGKKLQANILKLVGEAATIAILFLGLLIKVQID